MSTFLKAALMGLGKHAEVPEDAAHPTDRIEDAGSDLTPESQFLLRAGRRAIYDLAGQLSEAVTPVSPAPEAREDEWSPRFCRVLQKGFSTKNLGLLREFLNTLRSRHWSIPAPLLPEVMSLSDSSLRPLIAEVIGERGFWLSQFHPDWVWGELSLASEEETITRLTHDWNERTIAQRVSALAHIRKVDPGLGRDWICESFSKEKAADRKLLLTQIQIELSPEDMEFLERTLMDRSLPVRIIAAGLLAQLSTSKLSDRNRERGALLLQQSSLPGQSLKLTCHPPQQLPDDWSRDGIPEKPAMQRGLRGFWTEELIARVSLDFWTTHWNSPPVTLINGILNDDHAHSVICGWTRALPVSRLSAVEARSWVEPLWKYWLVMLQHPEKSVRMDAFQTLGSLAQQLSSIEREREILNLLKTQSDPTELPIRDLLGWLSETWTATFSKEILRITRGLANVHSDHAVIEWLNCLEVAAIAIPQETFEQALLPWTLRNHGTENWQLRRMEQLISEFTECVRIRRAFYEEIEARLAGNSQTP